MIGFTASMQWTPAVTRHLPAHRRHSSLQPPLAAPRVQAYFAQMKYKPKPFYRGGFFDLSEQVKLVGRMLVEMADRTRRMFHSHRSDSRIGSPVG
jgi:hypothetical protein